MSNMLKSIPEMIEDQRKLNAKNITIGEILNMLQTRHDSDELCFSNGKYFDGTFGSYRGYYEDIYIGMHHENIGFNTVGKLKDTLHKALLNGIMYGHKGGEFPITPNTLVWFAAHGTTNEAEMIVDIQKHHNKLVITTSAA